MVFTFERLGALWSARPDSAYAHLCPWVGFPDFLHSPLKLGVFSGHFTHSL